MAALLYPFMPLKAMQQPQALYCFIAQVPTHWLPYSKSTHILSHPTRAVTARHSATCRIASAVIILVSCNHSAIQCKS